MCGKSEDTRGLLEPCASGWFDQFTRVASGSEFRANQADVSLDVFRTERAAKASAASHEAGVRAVIQPGGSVRDALSLCDQVISYVGNEAIDEAKVAEVLGVAIGRLRPEYREVVTLRYEQGRPVECTAVVVSTQHGKGYHEGEREQEPLPVDETNVEELGEDTREMIRRNPGTAIGIAAVAGFFLARLFRK